MMQTKEINDLKVENNRLRQHLAMTEAARALLEQQNKRLVGDYNSEMYHQLESVQLQFAQLKIKFYSQQSQILTYIEREKYFAKEIEMLSNLIIQCQHAHCDYWRELPSSSSSSSASTNVDIYDQASTTSYTDAKHNNYSYDRAESPRKYSLNHSQSNALLSTSDSVESISSLTSTVDIKKNLMTQIQLEQLRQQVDRIQMELEDSRIREERYTNSVQQGRSKLDNYHHAIQVLRYQNTSIKAARNHWQQKAQSTSKELKYRLAELIPLQYALQQRNVRLEQVTKERDAFKEAMTLACSMLPKSNASISNTLASLLQSQFGKIKVFSALF